MKSYKALISYVSEHGLKPLPKTSVSEWADSYRMLSNTSAEPGRWKTSRAPYQKEIMDAFTQPGVHQVVVKSCSQIGKSDIMNNVIGRYAHLDPCAIMMVQPTVDMSEDFSKTRITPMIQDTKVLRDLFSDVKSRDSGNTILSKIFPGGRLIMCGANSPSGLASRPIRVLLCDEVDRFPTSAGSEGDPVDLASKRMTTFWNWVMGLFSTPTLDGSSRIDAAYLAGTQEEWQHQCPNCGEYHKLSYLNMETDAKPAAKVQGRTTYTITDVKWRCPDCGFAFSEREMKNAPQKYVAHNPEAMKNGCRSFFLNAFSSPWISWVTVMREWLDAKGDPDREKVVMNTRFGESYKAAGAFESDDFLLRRRENYGAELPDGVLMLTAGVDTQDNRLEYEVCGWGEGEECWGILKGVILGAPDQPTTWAELDKILDRVYRFKDGSGLKVLRTFIDSGGHYTGAVYNYCDRNYAKQRFAIKGQGGPGLPLNYKIGKSKGLTAPLVMLGVDDGKQQIMNRLSIKDVGPLYFHFPLDEEGVMTNRGYDGLYFRGLISEHKQTVKRNGTYREVWEPTQGVRNEPLDLRNYNLACMKSLHPDWERIKKVLTEAPMEPEKPSQTVKMAPRKPIKRSVNTNIW